MKEILSGCWFSSLFSLSALKCSPEIQPTPWSFPCVASLKAVSVAFLVAKGWDTGKPRAGDPGCVVSCWTARNHLSLHWSPALDFTLVELLWGQEVGCHGLGFPEADAEVELGEQDV